MYRTGMIDLIYSEDSDFMIYDDMKLVWKIGPNGDVDIYDHRESIISL